MLIRSSSRTLHSRRWLFASCCLLTACSNNMQMKMDAAWEDLDPMGHRRGHQARYYPRARSTGMRLPDGYYSGAPPLPGSAAAPRSEAGD